MYTNIQWPIQNVKFAKSMHDVKIYRFFIFLYLGRDSNSIFLLEKLIVLTLIKVFQQGQTYIEIDAKVYAFGINFN